MSLGPPAGCRFGTSLGHFARALRGEAMRGTSGTPRHTKLARYRCSLPGLAEFTGNRRTEPEVPRIGGNFARKRSLA